MEINLDVEKLKSEWEGLYSACKYMERILGFEQAVDNDLFNDAVKQVSLEYIDDVDSWLDSVEEFGYGKYE